MKFLYTIFLATTLASAACAQKVKIDFDRPATAGEKRQCKVSASYSQKYTITENGKNSAETLRKAKLVISGQMLILETVSNGNPAKVEFLVAAAQASLNGKTHAMDLAGKTLEIDLRQKTVCEFKIKGNEKPLSKTNIALLSLVFRPTSKWNLKDLMGTDKAVAPGDKWPAPVENILKQLNLKEVQNAKPDGFVKFEGVEDYNGIKCQKLTEEISLKAKDLSFEFSATVFLPEATKQSAVKIFRKGSQKSTKKLPQNDPLAGDKTITVEITDQLEATALPCK